MNIGEDDQILAHIAVLLGEDLLDFIDHFGPFVGLLGALIPIFSLNADDLGGEFAAALFIVADRAAPALGLRRDTLIPQYTSFPVICKWTVREKEY